ncbi:MAG: DUF427 domain-containing protein [Oscillatoriales cyanobacterium SM2_2_1]|nr:DUF427 domain-containing protein [Oscillatoriales cyanobacterium SM2_2_1]
MPLGSSSREQESVWSYPRPPRLESCQDPIQILFHGVLIVDTIRAFRVLETSHPPTYYLNPADIQRQYLIPESRTSFCEWKGIAQYYSIQVGDRLSIGAAWAYPNPTGAFAPLQDYVAFYAQKMDRCTVAGETVTPQPGGFYGGWITSWITGPFKGEPGTMGW